MDYLNLKRTPSAADIYGAKMASLLELVGDAVDSTLLRAFFDAGAEAFPTHAGSLRDLRERLARSPIRVRVEPAHGDHLRVTITDAGLGLTRRQLEEQLNGTRSRHSITVPEQMPLWMRPSRRAPSGVASAVREAELVTVDSRSPSGETLNVEVDGTGVRERSTPSALRGSGTEVHVLFSDHLFRALFIASGDQRAVPDRMDLDDLVADLVAAKLGDMVRDRLVPVIVGGRPLSERFDRRSALFVPELAVEVALPETSELGLFVVEAWHRGVPLADGDFDLDPLRGALPWQYNVHYGFSEDMIDPLTNWYSRWAYQDVGRRVRAALDVLARDRLTRVDDDQGRRAVCSVLSAHLFASADREASTLWRELPCASSASGYSSELSLGEAADMSEIAVEWSTENFVAAGGRRFSFTAGLGSSRVLPKLFPGIRVNAQSVVITRSPGTSVERSALFQGLSELVREAGGEAFRPEMLVCPDDWADLSIPVAPPRFVICDGEVGVIAPPQATACDGTSGAGWSGDPRTGARWFVSPWVFGGGRVVIPHPQQWARWVARKNGRSVRRVADVLLDLLVTCDPVLRADAHASVEYSLEAVREELALCS